MKVVAFLFDTATIALSHQKSINEDWDKYMVLNFKNLYLSKIELQVKVFGFTISMLRPCGLVIAPGLHPLLSETASHVSECLRCAWHRTG